MARGTTKLKGKRFRSVVADCNCLWEIKGSRGRGVFECEVVNEPIEIDGETYDSDFAGRRDVFTREHIEAAIAMEEFWQRSHDAHEEFYASLGDHQIVHYHDGFGQYVRCHAVKAPHDVPDADIKKGDRCLLEVALVGNWRKFDLRPDGYHARGIREGRLFKPNASNIYENPKASVRQKHPDPRHMTPIPHQSEGVG
jgi:hypothetical protein